MKYLLILFLFPLFSCNEKKSEISERELWEIKGKWRVQLEKLREAEKVSNYKIHIIQMDIYDYQNWKMISELEQKNK